jgi:exosortase A
MRHPAGHSMDHRAAAGIGALPAAGRWTLAVAALALYGAWLLTLYTGTVVSMVSIWYRSETFVHGFLIFPLSAWLVWRRRDRLRVLAPAPGTSLLPLALMLAGVGLWLGGELADVLTARHLGWVTMLVAGVWWLTGDRVGRALLFPLAFLYLAVPMGEFLLPTLMDWTADFTVWALRASGVPVLREGTNFQIPSGSWSVVEACSGLRYLIASVTVGVLFAYLTYTTLWRRLAFVVAAILVPILANWLRAYMIVMIGHLSNNHLAVGVDHLIYGWLFFGLVMGLLFWIGGFWREDDKPAAATSTLRAATSADAVPSVAAWARAVAIALAITALPVALVHALPSGGPRGALDAAAPPIPGWTQVAQAGPGWTPDFLPPRAQWNATYERGGERASLYVALYYREDAESKLVSSQNALIRTVNHAGYLVSSRARTLDLPTGPLSVEESVLRLGEQRVLARRWYWVNGGMTGSDVRAKLGQAISRLRGAGDAGAIVVVYAPIPADGPPSSPALDDLARAAAASVPAWLGERLQPRGEP